MTPRARHFAAVCLLVAGSLPGAAAAFSVVIDNGPPRTIYLRVGDGAFTGGNYADGGSPASNGTVNTVSVAVAGDQVGNGVAQTMAGNGRLSSDYDGGTRCSSGEVYIGGFYRTPNPGSTPRFAMVTVVSPASLVNASGDTLPISKISWTTGGNGDAAGSQPFGNGTFSGGTQTLSSGWERNHWLEGCYRFRYANDTIVPPGTYTATVTYTLVTP